MTRTCECCGIDLPLAAMVAGASKCLRCYERAAIERRFREEARSELWQLFAFLAVLAIATCLLLWWPMPGVSS
jgi:hypothetical protein